MFLYTLFKSFSTKAFVVVVVVVVVAISSQPLTLFRMMEGPKNSPTSFSPVTSTNVGISRQTFLTFNFNPFATLV